MKLSFILRQARSGELKSLSPKDKTDDVIIDYLNLALLALYSRFPIEVEEAIIALKDGKTIYRLDGTDTDVTVTGTDGNPQVITSDSVMTIIEAYDEASKIPLNDEDNEFSIHTPSYDIVQVPLSATGSYISIIYKKNPTIITYEAPGGVLVDKDVKLPMGLLEPLLHYIGYRAHGSLDGNINAENNTHLMRFEQSCKRIEMLGIITQDDLGRKNSDTGFIV